jgi:hypothetical protein
MINLWSALSILQRDLSRSRLGQSRETCVDAWCGQFSHSANLKNCLILASAHVSSSDTISLSQSCSASLRWVTKSPSLFPMNFFGGNRRSRRIAPYFSLISFSLNSRSCEYRYRPSLVAFVPSSLSSCPSTVKNVAFAAASSWKPVMIREIYRSAGQLSSCFALNSST